MIQMLILITAGTSIAFFIMASYGFFTATALKLYLQKKRKRDFNTQLADALTTISNCLKAGMSLAQSVEMVEKETEPPICEEFGILMREYKMGANLDDALRHLADRMNGQDIELAVTSMVIAHQLGGNLPENLERITNTIRHRNRIQRRIETLTAQGKMQGAVVSALPVALALVLYLLSPETTSLLFTTSIGQIMILLFFLLEITGWLLIRKIVKINV